MKQNWKNIVTDARLDRIESSCDRWTRITAWIVGVATMLWIVIPGVIEILEGK